MSDWLIYLLLAFSCCGGYWLLGFLARTSYNKITEGRR